MLVLVDAGEGSGGRESELEGSGRSTALAVSAAGLTDSRGAVERFRRSDYRFRNIRRFRSTLIERGIRDRGPLPLNVMRTGDH